MKRATKKTTFAERPNYRGTWYQRLFRSVASHITAMLVDTPITPNQVTALATILYIVPAYLLYQESVVLNILAILVIYCINILDKVDGQLARAKNMTSKRGIFLDGILHNVGVLAIYVPLGLRWYFLHYDFWAFAAAISSVILLYFTSFNYLNRAYLVASDPSNETNKLGVGELRTKGRFLVTLHSIPSQHFPEILILAFLFNQVPFILYVYAAYNLLTLIGFAYIFSKFQPA